MTALRVGDRVALDGFPTCLGVVIHANRRQVTILWDDDASENLATLHGRDPYSGEPFAVPTGRRWTRSFTRRRERTASKDRPFTGIGRHRTGEATCP